METQGSTWHVWKVNNTIIFTRELRAENNNLPIFKYESFCKQFYKVFLSHPASKKWKGSWKSVQEFSKHFHRFFRFNWTTTLPARVKSLASSLEPAALRSNNHRSSLRKRTTTSRINIPGTFGSLCHRSSPRYERKNARIYGRTCISAYISLRGGLKESGRCNRARYRLL